MDKELLLLEVRVLVLKYGYSAIINALASTSNMSVEKIQDEIHRLEGQRKGKTKPKKIVADDIVVRIIKENPSKANELKELFIRFKNKTFLPNLRDIRQFLDKYSSNPKVPKSRELAIKQVFITLASLGISQLQEFLSIPESDTRDDLSLISDQILGPR